MTKARIVGYETMFLSHFQASEHQKETRSKDPFGLSNVSFAPFGHGKKVRWR